MTRSSYDLRFAMREIARIQGFDPGNGPSLEEVTTDVTSETPTLAEMTTRQFEHPPIVPVGEAPSGRDLSSDVEGNSRAPLYSRHLHVPEGNVRER